MKSKLSYYLVTVFFLFFPTVVSAEPDDAPELLSRFSQYISSYTINDDGSFAHDQQWEMIVLKERAVAWAKKTSISYSTSIQKAEIKEAYTRKADGRRIDAPKSNFQVEVNKGNDKDAPVFSDMTTLTVVFPDVEVGDAVVFSYRLTTTEPMFPSQFSTLETFPRSAAFDQVRIRIDAPAKLWTQYQARQLKEVQNTEKGGRKILEWTYANPAPIKSKRKDYSVFDLEQEPGFAFSTFRNYAEIAAAYGVRARPKAAVTPRVQKLADDIAKDAKTPRDSARALYDWVSTNISYAGNCIGLGAVVPHDIDFILDNRMGDCKDHATLLEALLAAKGIASTQALINADSAYRLPKIPVVSTVNHVITYIPSLDLYADSTSTSTPFGMLPWSDIGKPVLLVDGYKEGARTPVPPIGGNQQIMKTVAKIKADGSVQGEVSVDLTGRFAVDARERFRDIPKDVETDFVKNVFQSYGYIGSGEFAKDDPKELLDTYKFSAKFVVENLLPVPGAFPISPIFYNEAPISGYVTAAFQEIEMNHETTCASGRSVEEYVYEFPQELKVLAVPPDMEVANEFLSYSASYKLKGNTLAVKRVFDDRTEGILCAPAISVAYKQFAQKVLPNLKAQVVYQ